MFDFLENLRKTDEMKRQEAITAYLDGALTPGERRRFEEKLAADETLRAEVEQQRLIKENLQRLPFVRSPRNFTLNPALYGRPAPEPAGRLYPALRAATVLVAFFFVIAVAAELLTFAGRGGPSLALAPMADESAEISKEVIVSESEGAPMGATAARSVVAEEALAVQAEAEEMVAEAEMAAEAPAEEMPIPIEEPVVEEAAADETVPEETFAAEETEPGIGVAAPIHTEGRDQTEDGVATDGDIGNAVAGGGDSTTSETEAPKALPTETGGEQAAEALAAQAPTAKVEPSRTVSATSTAQALAAEELSPDEVEAIDDEVEATQVRTSISPFRIFIVALGLAVTLLTAVTLLARRKV
jgi:anti-sigma factor RsiW